MTIDLERLAVDLDYWDEVAPEGASHLIDEFTFTKWEYGQEFSWDIGRDAAWVANDPIYPLSRYLKEGDKWKVLAKPKTPKSHPTDTQPAESGAQISAEWDGDLPPEGADCEYGTGFGKWSPAKCIARGHDQSEDAAVIQTANRMYIVSKTDIHNLRGPYRQRQRDELISEIKADLDALNVKHANNLAAGLAIGMINRGWRKVDDK
jgi:hypothetical protein